MEISYPDLSGKTCLIVEDDKTSFNLLRRILKRCHLEILWAQTGREAIDMALNKAIDLVLMDIKMPDIDGLEATRAIKKKKPNLPIIAQTAFALSGDEQRTYDAGCDYYVTKPIERVRLINAIRKSLKT
ncbi:MAG: response regulator [Bacteroidales bacterium]|nr:response regulator [Bacteroidales bacterium]